MHPVSGSRTFSSGPGFAEALVILILLITVGIAVILSLVIIRYILILTADIAVLPSVVHIPQVHIEIDDSDFELGVHPQRSSIGTGQTLDYPCIPTQIALFASQTCQKMHICLIGVLICATATLPPEPELHRATTQDRKLIIITFSRVCFALPFSWGMTVNLYIIMDHQR